MNGFYISRVENARDLELPKYQTEGSSGMDLRANVFGNLVLAPGKFLPVDTGIKISIPKGYEAQIRPRSGLAAKHGISMVNAPGTIDSDYRGEIKVILINYGKEPFEITRGMRIAQMVFAKIEQVEFTLTDELDETKRSDGGFGHTGLTCDTL